MEIITNRWGHDISKFFLPILMQDAYGIFDTELNKFVRTRDSNKVVWAKPAYAKNAFANATGIRISEQIRYEVRRIENQ